MIANCKCIHAGQDQLHGPGKRVHNVTPPKGTKPASKKCTVCGAVTGVIGFTTPETEKKKKKQ